MAESGGEDSTAGSSVTDDKSELVSYCVYVQSCTALKPRRYKMFVVLQELFGDALPSRSWPSGAS